jgi:hypothetical protein
MTDAIAAMYAAESNVDRVDMVFLLDDDAEPSRFGLRVQSDDRSAFQGVAAMS